MVEKDSMMQGQSHRSNRQCSLTSCKLYSGKIKPMASFSFVHGGGPADLYVWLSSDTDQTAGSSFQTPLFKRKICLHYLLRDSKYIHFKETAYHITAQCLLSLVRHLQKETEEAFKTRSLCVFTTFLSLFRAAIPLIRLPTAFTASIQAQLFCYLYHQKTEARLVPFHGLNRQIQSFHKRLLKITFKKCS